MTSMFVDVFAVLLRGGRRAGSLRGN